MNDLYYDELLLDICRKRMKEIYGNDIPEEAKTRLDEELKTVRAKKLAPLLISFSNAVKKADPNKRTLSSLYGWSSYITYLLGLNIFDPLDRDLMNGHICNVEYAKSELSGWYAIAFYTALDMIGKIAANIETEECVEKVCRSYMGVSAENDQVIYDVITNGCIAEYDDSFEIIFKRDKRIEFIDFLAELTGTDPLLLPYCDKSVIDFILDSADNSHVKRGIYLFEDEEALGDIIKTVKPTDFYQLSKAVGLYRSFETWCEDVKNEFSEETGDLDKAITTRNDAFDYFKAELGDSEKAYLASTKVRRGQSLVDTEFEKYADNKEIRRIKYLPPRPRTLYDARIICTLAYYKMNYPEEFDFAYSKYMAK